MENCENCKYHSGNVCKVPIWENAVLYYGIDPDRVTCCNLYEEAPHDDGAERCCI